MRRHKLFTATVAAIGIAAGVGAYEGYDYIHSGDGSLPEVTAEGIPRTRSYLCFADAPNCDDTNALAILESEGNEIPITLEEVPQAAIDALISTEDRNFFTHDGVDDPGIVRAIGRNAWESLKTFSLSADAGGSTITMQLVRHMFLESRPSNKGERKVWEWRKAVTLEKDYIAEEKAKDPTVSDADAKYRAKLRILNEYFNIVYFGRGAYGIEAAAQAYFGVSAKDLSEDKNAALIAAVNAPSYLEGSSDQAKNITIMADFKERRDKVINDLAENGKIPKDRVAALQAEPLGVTDFHNFPYGPTSDFRNADGTESRHFVDIVMTQLSEVATRTGLTDKQLRSGLRINTTLNYFVQGQIVNAINSVSLPDDGRQLAAVVVDEDGSVRGMYGGNYDISQVNLVDSLQPGGSADKPYFYTMGLMKGTVQPTYVEEPFTWPGGNNGEDWPIDKGMHCPDRSSCPWDVALAESSNPIALKVAYDLGQDGLGVTYSLMDSFGLHSTSPVEPASVLGAREATVLGRTIGMEGLIGNDGTPLLPKFITSITALENGQFVDKGYPQPPAQNQIVPKEVSDQVLGALRGTIQYGTASSISYLGEMTDVAGKTGTDDESKIANIYMVVCIDPGDGSPKHNLAIGVDLRYLDGLRPLLDANGKGEAGGKTPALVAGKIAQPIIRQSCQIDD